MFLISTRISDPDRDIFDKPARLARIKAIFPYRHQQEKVDQLDKLLDKMNDVAKGHASLNDVIQLPFFSEIREKNLSLNK
ncbi:MAG: hypothetical protein OXD32_08495 [Endozoicomonadaceae bacterium]|nr:hypothetical protein [Endozoicomonadaceae bacterium]